MKRIELVIDRDSLGGFTEAAKGLNLFEFDVTEVRRAPSATSRERRRLYRGREFVLDLVERLKVDLTVADDAAMRIAHELIDLVRPESIVVFRLDHAVVLTGEVAARSTRIAEVSNPMSLVAAR
jgi:nitrogen regulatory protein PII